MTYPFSSPIILTDSLFTAYGGSTGTSTNAQRQAAYVMSEEQISTSIGTLLKLAIVTGTFAYPNVGHFPLDWNRVSRLIKTTFIDFDGVEILSVDGEASGYINLRDKEMGDVDINYSHYSSAHGNVYPFYHVRIVYECGIPSGTSYHPNLLLALAIEADIILAEIVGYGNESDGDIGIQSFRNQEYSETRSPLRNTVLGNSPRAMFADRMLETFRVRSRGLGM